MNTTNVQGECETLTRLPDMSIEGGASIARTPSAQRNILAAIGNTPLVQLERVFPCLPFHLFAKLEMLNPGGSTKDRPALNIIRRAVESGALQPGAVVVESSSGNMGIGLAQACSYYGLKFICVIDPKTTQQNINILRAYGAEIDLVAEPDPVTKDFLPARIKRVRQLLATIKHSFWPNQYANEDNARAHMQTMREIVAALAGRVDYLFCATSTCGTMRGCAEHIREAGLPTKVIAVDAVGSIIFGGQKAPRLIPGHGAALVPQLFSPDLAARCVHITDLDCVVGCRTLIRREGILAGGSSGAVLMGVHHLRREIPRGATCVMIFPDRGERYLDTIYSDAWVSRHFGTDVLASVVTTEANVCAPMMS
jgi:cysteine synthase A